MNSGSEAFEAHRFVYILAQIFIGFPLTFWGFIVWSFNVFLLRKRQSGKFFGTLSFMELSLALRTIRNGSTSWKALNVVYNWFGHFGFVPEIPRDPFAYFWIGNLNAQAVRNRLRIIVREMKAAILDVAGSEEEVRILSIASGSAQSLFLAIKALKEKGFNKRIRLFLLDLDKTTLEYSLTLTNHFGIARNEIILKRASTNSLEKILKTNGFYPHIIEMAGFLDYRPDKKAIDLMQNIHRLLLPNGWFITCHIHPNIEQHFTRWVLCWSMLYRNKDDFLRLLKESGDWDIQYFTEPHNIHTVAVCQKNR